MAKVELKGIGKVYDGGVRAVTNANIVVEDKEFVVFVGPSGCGKSTTTVIRATASGKHLQRFCRPIFHRLWKKRSGFSKHITSRCGTPVPHAILTVPPTRPFAELYQTTSDRF